MTIVNNLTQFTPDTKALSSEVNNNFETLRTAHNDTDNNLSTLQTSFDNLDSKAVLKDGTNAFGADQSMGGFKLTDMAEPLNLQDAATKNYVDALSFDTHGCNIANNLSNPDNDIDISAGQFWNDNFTKKISLNSSLTKRLDALWLAGTGNGGLDTGSKTNSTDYYIFLIAKADATSDILFSASSSGPTMPSDYVYKRLLGAFRTDSNGNIIPAKYFRSGDLLRVEYAALLQEYNSITPPTVSTDLTLTGIPSLANCRAILYCELASNQSSGFRNSEMYLKDKITGLEKAVLLSNYDYYYVQNVKDTVLINTSNKTIQHKYYTDAASGASTYIISTQGYEVIL